MAQVFNSIPPIQRGSDLFICLHETLQLNVQVTVLSLKHVAVIVECIDLSPDIVVSLLH